MNYEELCLFNREYWVRIVYRLYISIVQKHVQIGLRLLAGSLLDRKSDLLVILIRLKYS